MQLSRERATTNDGSDLQVLRFYDDLQKRFAAGSYPTASKVNYAPRGNIIKTRDLPYHA